MRIAGLGEETRLALRLVDPLSGDVEVLAFNLDAYEFAAAADG